MLQEIKPAGQVVLYPVNGESIKLRLTGYAKESEHLLRGETLDEVKKFFVVAPSHIIEILDDESAKEGNSMETSIEEGTVMSYPDHEDFVILAIGNEPDWFLVQIIGENIPYWTKRSMDAFPRLGKNKELLERGRRLATEQGLPLQLQNC